ncbi:MAG: acyl-CoA dehydrogenase family protein [Acidimicrobiia bacterium]|nr:acyl-CoA dehydrogenase family protein [Acidimicrobiia bacterium]
MSSGTESSSASTAAEVRSWLAENWDDTLDRKSWLGLVADSGWAAPSWPEQWYGRGLDPEQTNVVLAEFRAVGADGTAQDKNNLWANTVLAFGSDELKKRFLKPLLLGEVGMCLLYSEPGAGSDLAGIQTRAERDGDEWVVNGQKVWTSGGRKADYALLITRTDWDVPKHRGITFFWFPMKQPGVEVRPLRQATGDARFNEVFLTDARVSHLNMLGEQNNGWMVLQSALAYERAAMGENQRRRRTQPADNAVRSADDDAPAPVPDLSLVELARDVGKADDKLIRQRVAHLHCLVQVNEWNNRRAKAELAQGTTSSVVSLGKLAMSRILHTAGGLQTAILGAEAMTGGEDSPRSADATYALLNAFFTSIGGGTDQIQRNIIGERILGLPKEPELDKSAPFRDVLKAPARRAEQGGR